MAENDVQLDLKKRARRRLVGAIALALLAAIVLPMVMDSEPLPGSQDLSIRIPAKDQDMLALRPSDKAPAPQPPQLPQVGQEVAPAPIEADPEELPATRTPSPSVPSVSPSVASASSSIRRPERSVASSSAPARNTNEAARARQILEGAGGNAPAAVANGRFFVQLGLYREEANAKGVLTKAREAGIKASSERQGGQFRVIAGPFATRGEADGILAKVRKAGLSGFVTSK
ncbi:MAG: SPOR domain-containing protein [Candidatus Dactylopiibacterium carminicum]|uniref:SPOR domain-containing protein n=1 Tax=Candidatus Dactylopiibacterium carminicum TaxID=857335 RepID=A0A272EXY8_9RHOO|nr:SPOR domain-containing protein [Candidatus Dactylopiibacterium carminicum]KAF7600525.1 SPOR domain-containing protein [Candidatus Dactylopiibacterium carminicum]PAS94906.1 MAG: SPOR domain-containing protein [Candidatus Dactylopiibacterium carminicum]PAS98042.1 MAG: SPOR domain-containing protein [Candidatus Dactylopiibacterium carminicum]PAT00531.1 MAG: hypothetical protein BSR46_02200 [Candidatus Dactylopiibacterium carminicum]